MVAVQVWMSATCDRWCLVVNKKEGTGRDIWFILPTDMNDKRGGTELLHKSSVTV